MSHVALVELEVTSLDDLEQAARRIGLELVRGQQTYRAYWTAESIQQLIAENGEERLRSFVPEGFSASEYGKCEHAIRIADPSRQETSYEIGVARRRDGKPGWALLWDDMGSRHGLGELAGPGLGRLKQSYALVAARRTALQQGFSVSERQQADGSVQLVLRK